MDDAAIVTLFWQRDERAIRESEQKYGGYCRSIARSLLSDEQDAEEILSDTWLRAWNYIRPQKGVQSRETTGFERPFSVHTA